MSYSLNVQIGTDSISALKGSKYNLCIAKAVNGKYNVVWSGNKKYLDNNTFRFTDQFRVFGTGTFEDGTFVEASTKEIPILEGMPLSTCQQIVLNKTRAFGTVTGIPKSGEPIHIKNEYGTINLGVQVYSPSSQRYSNIFSSEVPYASGTVGLRPKRSLMVWFDQKLETNRMFSCVISNVIVVDFPTNTNNITISYVAPANEPNHGTWSLGPIPLLSRTYEPETNTFKIEDKYFPKPELIRLWNDSVDEGDSVGSTAY